MIHYLERAQVIPASLEEVWNYFATPQNLNALTPPDMHFEILHGGIGSMYAGQIIEYRVEFMRGLRSRWLTEITQVRPNYYFVDEQCVGPYRLWHHEHSFSLVPVGVAMRDRVTYVPPLGWLGTLANVIWIKRRLDYIFDFRQRKIVEIFGALK